MDDGNKITRRDMLGRSLLLGAVATVGTNVFLTACGGSSGPNCGGTAGLSAEDKATRDGNQYADTAVDPAKKCSGCNFFTSAGAAACGTCAVVKGTINPGGGCRLWVAKQA
jgi:hypothetical protein